MDRGHDKIIVSGTVRRSAECALCRAFHILQTGRQLIGNSVDIICKFSQVRGVEGELIVESPSALLIVNILKFVCEITSIPLRSFTLRHALFKVGMFLGLGIGVFRLCIIGFIFNCDLVSGLNLAHIYIGRVAVNGQLFDVLSLVAVCFGQIDVERTGVVLSVDEISFALLDISPVSLSKPS